MIFMPNQCRMVVVRRFRVFSLKFCYIRSCAKLNSVRLQESVSKLSKTVWKAFFTPPNFLRFVLVTRRFPRFLISDFVCLLSHNDAILQFSKEHGFRVLFFAHFCLCYHYSFHLCFCSIFYFLVASLSVCFVLLFP